MRKHTFLPLFVFITGATVLAIEMVALKQAIPYFGGSIFIWALVIGTAMAALSAGYYWGGKLADRHQEKEAWLFGITLTAGIMAGGVFYLHTLINPLISLISLNPAFDSPLYLILLFALPVTLLGMVSPFAVRIRNTHIDTTGESAGSIYAFSTAGSIFGVYASSFFLLPAFGSRTTVLILSLVLIAASAAGWLLYVKKGYRSAALFAACAILSFSFYHASFSFKEGIIYEQESFYGAIQVKAQPDGSMYLDINSSGRWSVYHPDKVLTGMYFDYFTPLYHLFPDAHEKRMAIVGHAGGVISRQYSHFFQGRNMRIDGLELDPLVTRAAREFFHIDRHENLTVINGDARIFLRQNDTAYDLIAADAYTGALYLPFNLATKEFFTIVRDSLTPEGVFAQHILGETTEEKVPSCVAGTLLEVFPYVYFIDISIPHSHLLLASGSPLESRLAGLEHSIEHEGLEPIQLRLAKHFTAAQATGCVLTDNKAPTELLREQDNVRRDFFGG